MFRILHLSDIHIGKTYKKPEDIAYQVTSDIEHMGLSTINCIIVTGDIFDGQVIVTEQLIGDVVHFFDVLLNEINESQSQMPIGKEDIVFVPGNHDLIRSDDIKERWSKYHKFLEKFYGVIPSFYDHENYSLFKEYRDHKVAFVGFNSCEIEKRKVFDNEYMKKFEAHINSDKLNAHGIDKSKVIEVMKSEIASDYDDYGYISLSQIIPIERKVRKLDDYTIVALFHHHFYLFPEIAQQFGDSSLIRNYSEVIQHLKYMNVSVVLHGHKHFALERPFITDDYYESSENIIDVFAGGSVGTDRKEEHTFGVLELYERKDDIKLKHYKVVYNGENLEPIKIKQVPPKQSSSRVVKLKELLKTLEPEQFRLYEETAEKAFKSYDDCNKIIAWVSEAITGFTEVSKFLEDDCNNILFLLYAINYRTICYMKMVAKEESYFRTAAKNWDSFYERHLQQTDFMVSKVDYHNMFMHKGLKEAALLCDQLLNRCDNKKSQVYLAFTMLGMFFADLYLVLTKYADDFKETIKYKVNIKIEENKFHENVPAPRIIIKSDADRRSAYIELLCNEATAHKMAVLFVKEFDLLISKFEDYFKIIGLKLYYLLPRIDRDRMKNTLDNYNFEAYIPTLIPLLTGKNIYSSKLVFARELIQNSIDAISVREAKDKKDFSKKIQIELKTDHNGKRYFKIIDNGTGMDRYQIERYFTSIGRSFYAGQEYEDLNISYKPISNFGIGFLSSFMVCQEIDVKTKYYIDGSKGLKLHIPNYDGCFFIELEEDAPIGTEVKLYLDDLIANRRIVGYIRRVMQDIKYDIDIRYLDEEGEERKAYIESHSIRKQNEDKDFRFFIPFLENGEVATVDYKKDILSGDFENEYDYGLLIRKIKNAKLDSESIILNSGIVVERASLEGLFGKNFIRYHYNHEGMGKYNKVIVNFPSNWLQIDVSRENITGFSNFSDDKENRSRSYQVGSQIAASLYQQILQFIQYWKNRTTDISAVCLQDVIEVAINFIGEQECEKELRRKLTGLKYVVVIEFFNDGLCYKITRNESQGEAIQIIYSGEQARTMRDIWLEEWYKYNERNHILKQQVEDMARIRNYVKEILGLCKEIIYRKEMFDNHQITYRIENLLQDAQEDFGIEGSRRNIFILLTLVILAIPDEIICDDTKKQPYITVILESIFLQYFYIGEEQKQEIKINYDELFEIFGIEIEEE